MIKQELLVSRRRLLENSIKSTLYAPLVSAQMMTPAGTIKVAGSTAYFSVDYGRPLESVAFTFIRVYGWPITFEEAPLIYSGDIVDVTRNSSLGIRVFDPRGGRLEFSYGMNPDGTPPQDPGPVLRAAIKAYHQANLPGRYDLVSSDGYFHIIPKECANERGTLQPVQSPLDAVVTIQGGGRPVGSVFDELVKSMATFSGFHIVVANDPFSQGSQPMIDKRYDQADARTVLKALIRTTGKRRVWYLMYGIRQKCYFLSVV